MNGLWFLTLVSQGVSVAFKNPAPKNIKNLILFLFLSLKEQRQQIPDEVIHSSCLVGCYSIKKTNWSDVLLHKGLCNY